MPASWVHTAAPTTALRAPRPLATARDHPAPHLFHLSFFTAGVGKFFFCKGPDYKYFRLCGTRGLNDIFLKQCFQHAQAILSLWAVERQATSCTLPTSDPRLTV